MKRVCTLIFALFLLTVLLAACGGAAPIPTAPPGEPEPSRPLPPATESEPPPAADPTDAAATLPALPTPTEATMSDDPSAGAVPADLLAQMKQDLADRIGVSIDSIVVVSAEAVMWRDSSLGCPEPGMMYLQVLTEGYQVLLEAQGQIYDYRASTRGFFRWCPGGDGGEAIQP